jgi:hypothetical protein
LERRFDGVNPIGAGSVAGGGEGEVDAANRRDAMNKMGEIGEIVFMVLIPSSQERGFAAPPRDLLFCGNIA